MATRAQTDRLRRASPCALAALLFSSSPALAQAPATPPPSETPPAPRLTRPPSLLRFVEAAYPESERAAAHPAAVDLQIVIGAGGLVEEAKVEASAGPAFDEAALAAVRAFVFSPAEIDGKPARIRIEYRYQFVLRVALPTTAVFRGLVRKRAGLLPLPGVTVALEGVGSVITDVAGQFEMKEVPPGRRRVTLSGPGFSPTRLEEELVAGRELAARYDVTMAEPVAEAGPADDMEIVVSAPPVRRQAVSTEVSTAQARQVPGTQGDVLRVVENLPGVARAAAGSGALVVWGAAPEDTRVYIDGVPVPRLYHDGGLRSVLPSELVGSVELTPGGYGPAYGRGLGGLVTVGTRNLDEPGVHGALVLDFYDISGSIRVAIGKRLHVSLALRRSHLDALLSAVSPHAGDYFPIPHYYDGQARVAYQLGPKESLELTGLFSTDHLSRGTDNLDPLLVAREVRDVNFYRVYGRYRRQLDDGALVSVTPFVGVDHNVDSMDVGGTVAGVQTDTVMAGLRASYRGRVASWLTMEVGIDADVRKSTVTRNGSIALPPREGDVRVFGQPPPDTLSADHWETMLVGVAPYAEGDVSLLHGALHILPGLRVDPNVRSVNRSTPAVGDTPQIGLFAQDFSVEPRLTLRYTPTATLTLKAAAGYYHQQPAPEDLGAVFGNPSLPTAHVTQVLAGAAVSVTHTLTVEATGFYAQSGELAVRSPLPSPVLAQALVGTGEGRSYGLQVLLRQEMFHHFFGWLSYTLSRSERRADGASDYRLSDYDQTHLFTAVAAYMLPLGFEAGLRLRVATGYPRTPVVGAFFDAQHDLYQPIFGPQNSDRLPLFVQLDTRVARHFRIGPTDLEAYLDLQNLTNQANAEEVVYNHDYTQKGYITGLPILLVAGFRWTF